MNFDDALERWSYLTNERYELTKYFLIRIFSGKKLERIEKEIKDLDEIMIKCLVDELEKDPDWKPQFILNAYLDLKQTRQNSDTNI